MMQITVNDQPVQAQEGETILTALDRAGVHVPTLCHLRDRVPTGTCRMCVVEVEGARSLVPSCSAPVAAGMVVRTDTPRAQRARKTMVELLLANHPDDCLYCVRNGTCDLQDLAARYGVRNRRYAGQKNEYRLDLSSPSLVRDPAKCVLCGKCVRVCEEIQGVAAIDFIGRGSRARVGTAYDTGLNVSSCINCGQCITVCPTAALHEQSHAKLVADALRDPSRKVVVQHAPSVSVTIAEEFGLKPGVDSAGALVAALRRMGFDAVFDTSFGADLTVMEEASELVARVKGGGPLPLMTSCSPGWVKFVETFYPHRIPNLSTCKSPQQMLGAVTKSYWAEQRGLDPRSVFGVSIMPCTAKKFEVGRGAMMHEGIADVDAVLTTRELARMIKVYGLDLANLAPEGPDNPFGLRSSAGKLFGASGGVAEAALRTAYHLLTGEELPMKSIKELRGLDGQKHFTVSVAGVELGVAVVSGLANARVLLDELDRGRSDVHFIEVMTCPGGCVNGGGQPLRADMKAIRARLKALYDIDRDDELRTAHANPYIRELYARYLGEPLSHRSHELLHTQYQRREVLR